MRSMFNGHGFGLSDNRNSGGSFEQFDVLTCKHCQAIINVQNWKAGDGGSGYCIRCNAPICGPCADRMLTEGCVPFMKKLDEALDADYRRQQLRKIMGLD